MNRALELARKVTKSAISSGAESAQCRQLQHISVSVLLKHDTLKTALGLSGLASFGVHRTWRRQRARGCTERMRYGR
jgi:hypothetical protein|eukprot:COSAG02_NODE_5650_length_4150_cov_1.949148_3_plen_77_part_00